MIDRTLASLSAIIALGVMSWSLPRSARACGGMFCSQPQPNAVLPIAQAGENVLFVLDSDPANGTKRVEAHIQILYTGPAAEFSWIVPVTAVPTVEVGWDILFDRLEPPTRPSFQVSFATEGTCSDSFGDGAGCVTSDSARGASATGAGGAGGVVNPAVDVLARGSVGPYDYVVVRSEEGATLRNWLTTNRYFVSDEAARIIDGYVAGGFSFVAVKLRAGVETTAIRPIILRMYSPEACLPLKLTAIATTPDLRINVWVLGEARAVPINYAELVLNLAKLDWFNAGQNYDQLIKDAANEARGNAFAVEYAQPSDAAIGWFSVNDASASLGLISDPASYVAALGSLGLPPTGEVLKLLRKHIPMPPAVAAQGVTEASFYFNLSFFASQLGPVDLAALTADLETEVFVPMDRLRPLFEQNPYLTRLATFISADEMTHDPLFVTNSTLPDVSPRHLAIANVLCGDEDYDSCNAPVRLRLEDGQDVMFRRTTSCGPFDRAALDQMPASEMAWSRDAQSSGALTVDNRTMIRSALAAHNTQVNAGLDFGCGCGTRGRPRKLASLMLFAIGLGVVFVTRRRKRS